MSLSPEECPNESVHGNPFRYCPSCSWVEEVPAKADADQFLRKAKESVIRAEDHIDFTPNDLYVVWFCKVLGNWKALISTDMYAGAYWEVTYNGAKQETYVDTYAKRSNRVIADA